MLELVFITYVLAMLALLLSIWVWSEIRDIKKVVFRKDTKKRVVPKPPAPPIKRPKGLWD